MVLTPTQIKLKGFSKTRFINQTLNMIDVLWVDIVFPCTGVIQLIMHDHEFDFIVKTLNC